MEYIVIFDPNQRNCSMLESSNCFLETFMSYEDAKEEAEDWKANGDCKSYSIYAKCTDERNHVI